jgi:hypothetical protein
LHMLKIGATQTYLDPIRAGINDIQELSKTHEIVSKAKTELWHRLLTTIFRSTSPRSRALQATPAATGSSPSSRHSRLRPASQHTQRMRSSRRPGTSSARRSRKPDCWAISTRQHEVRLGCRCRWIAQQSQCSGW